MYKYTKVLRIIALLAVLFSFTACSSETPTNQSETLDRGSKDVTVTSKPTPKVEQSTDVGKEQDVKKVQIEWFDVPESLLDYRYDSRLEGVVVKTYIGQPHIRYPETINGDPVVGIEGANVIHNTVLESVWLPDTVKYIGKEAFTGSVNLTNINFPNDLEVIDKFAFQDCTGLTSIKLPAGVRELGYGAFQNCENVTELILSESIEKIDTFAFNSCINITSITIPVSELILSPKAFSGCDKLVDISIPEAADFKGGWFEDTYWYHRQPPGFIYLNTNLLGYKANDAGEYRRELTHYTIPDGTTSIGSGVFERFESLTSVDIPDSVVVVHPAAFHRCENLDEATTQRILSLNPESRFTN